MRNASDKTKHVHDGHPWGSAVKCGRCGAENAAHMERCGNCGGLLNASTKARSSDGIVSSIGLEASGKRTKMDTPSSEFGPGQNRPAEWLASTMVVGLILAIIGVVSLLISLATGDEIPIYAILITLLGLLSLLAPFLLSRRGSRTAQFIWQRGDGLAPLATSRGVNVLAILAIPFVMCSVILIEVLFLDEIPIEIPIVVGALISAALMVGFVRSKMLIQSDSILQGIPSAPMMGRLPLNMVQSIRLRGRVMRIVLKERINPLSSRTQRILILGDPRPVAAAIQAIGIVRGYDFSIENVELDPTLLSSFTTSLRKEEGGLSRVDGGRYIIGGRTPLLERTSYADIVSMLLAFAGVITLLFGMVLLAINKSILDEYGQHVLCLEGCIILEFLFGVLMLLGALMARRRRRISLVRASAVFAIISVGGFVSIVLGIVSLFMLRKCADEFID